MATPDFAGPQSAAAIAEQVARYRLKTVVKSEGIAFERPRPPHRRKSKAPVYAVPPLTEIALEALVRGFEAHPSSQGLPLKFASQLAAKLPPTLDIRVSAPHIHDEAYWRRACIEGHGWSHSEVAQHGMSWKQMCCEKVVAQLLEQFGLYLDLPPGYEEEFCRPPIDGTHPRWAELYPKARLTRVDGRPAKERFCANALDENETDMRIVNGSDTGWPRLEALKAATRAQVPQYAQSYAWSSFDRSPYTAAGDGAVGGGSSAAAAAAAAAAPPSPDSVEGLLQLLGPTSTAAATLRASVANIAAAAAAKAALAEAAAAGGKSATKGKGGSDDKKDGKKKKKKAEAVEAAPPPDPAAEAAAAALAPLLPYLPGGDLHGLASDAARLWEEDAFDCQCSASHLREFVHPDVLAEWRRTGRWPQAGKGAADGGAEDNPAATISGAPREGRAESILVLRSRELQVLLDRISACEDHVFSLTLAQLPSHCDLELIMSRLPNLTSLTLSYGMRHIGMRYDRGLFGMRIADAESLARCVKLTDTLTSLSLPSNGIDDNMLLVLMSGLLPNATLTHLDLSHNAITSAGVQLLAKLLRGPSVLASLSLADNRADERSGRFLGKALRGNTALTDLNLRLNSLGDTGGAQLLEALMEVPLSSSSSAAAAAATGGGLPPPPAAAALACSLTTLNLASNHLGAASAAAFAALLREQGGGATAAADASGGDGGTGSGGMVAGAAGGGVCPLLSSIDLSGNALVEEDAAVIAAAVDASTRVTSVDLRGNPGIAPTSESLQAVLAATRRNEVAARGGPSAPLTGVFAVSFAAAPPSP